MIARPPTSAATGGLIRKRLRPQDIRTLALVVGALVLLSFIGVSTLGVGDGGGLPGDGLSLPEAIFGPAALKPEAGYPRLKIPRLGINLLIAEGDGKTPPAKAEAWVYPGTAWPGDSGNTYLYAHDRRGAFLPLHQARSGDLVEVDFGGGRVIRYLVTEIHSSVRYNDFEFVDYRTSGQRLTLQTCDGWRDQDPRFIVIANPVPA
jgi:LPXTG-site transpeptidase (sortase) family protein